MAPAEGKSHDSQHQCLPALGTRDTSWAIEGEIYSHMRVSEGSSILRTHTLSSMYYWKGHVHMKLGAGYTQHIIGSENG